MSFFDGIDFVVSDAKNAVGAVGSAVGSAAAAVSAGAAAGAAVAGGGVTMDRDEMTAFLQQVKQTQALCQQQVRTTFNVQRLTAPANDQASAMFTNAAQTSRDVRNQYLQDQLKMYNDLVDKLENALGRTTESDHLAGAAVNQAAGGGKYS